MPTPEAFTTMPTGLDYAQAYAEASRCLLCYDPPCSKACPGNTDPARFIRQFRMRNVTGAIRTIKQNNILGGSCGHLCPTAELCEAECSASGLDRPIRIGAIQRFLVEHSWKIGFKPLQPAAPREERVACLGSGPASLSCAATLAREGVRVTVFERYDKAGGALRFGVPASRFSDAFLDRELEDLRDLGVEFRFNSPVEGAAAAESLLKDGYDAVFLAPGCWTSLHIGDSAESMEGLTRAMTFLPELRQGHYDDWKARIADRSVAVIGGGSVAMDCVMAAIQLGAKDVYLVYRRSYTQMPAEEKERLETLRAGCHYVLLNQPVGYERGPKGALTGVRLQRTRLGDADDSGRRRPEPIDGSDWVLACDLCIEAIGQRPVDETAATYPSVQQHGGLVVADPDTGKTSVDGIYAGGDVVRGPSLIINAIRDGKVAARAIMRQLGGRA